MGQIIVLILTSTKRSFIQILKAFLPAMLDNNYGHIVTIASGAGLTGASGLVDYCSSKFAAVGLHEALTYGTPFAALLCSL